MSVKTRKIEMTRLRPPFAREARLHAVRDDGLDGDHDGHHRQRVLAAEPVVRHLPGAAGGVRHAAAAARGRRHGPEGSGHGRRRHVFRAAWSARSTSTSRRCCRTRSARSARIRPGRSTPTRSARPTCASAVTIMYVPTTTAQTTIRDGHADAVGRAEGRSSSRAAATTTATAVRVQRRHARPHHEPDGDYDIFTITNVQDIGAPPAAPRRQVHDARTPAGSWITQVVSHTYYLEDDGDQHATSCGTTTATRPTCRSPTTSWTSASSSSAIRRRRRSSSPVDATRRRALDDVRSAAAGDRHRQRRRTRGRPARTASSRSTGHRACRCARPADADARRRPTAAGADAGLDADRRSVVPGGR